MGFGKGKREKEISKQLHRPSAIYTYSANLLAHLNLLQDPHANAKSVRWHRVTSEVKSSFLVYLISRKIQLPT